MDQFEIVMISTMILITGMVCLHIGLIEGIGGKVGEHTGYVTAVDFKDNLVWDSTIVYFKTDTESTQEDNYCVNDEILIKILKEKSRNHEKITIKYSNPYMLWRWKCNGGNSIINNIEY